VAQLAGPGGVWFAGVIGFRWRVCSRQDSCGAMPTK
jgi:hypothetical protein